MSNSNEIKDVERLLKIKENFEKSGMKANIKMKKIIHNLKVRNEDVFNKAREFGLNELEATILANRINTVVDIDKYIYPRYQNVMDYKLLKDIDKATDIIIDYINKGKRIMFAPDIDTD